MNVWAVGLFGVVGACLRYATGVWVHEWWPSMFPLGTLMINWIGCLILGWFSSWAASKPGLPPWFRLGFGTGLVGSFTTFSTFSVETVSLLQDRLVFLALLYVIFSLLGGLAFAWMGYAGFRLQTRQRNEEVKTP